MFYTTITEKEIRIRKNGVPGGSRTHDLQRRKLTLYPAELRVRNMKTIINYNVFV